MELLNLFDIGGIFTALVLVTNDPRLAERCGRSINITAGELAAAPAQVQAGQRQGLGQ